MDMDFGSDFYQLIHRGFQKENSHQTILFLDYQPMLILMTRNWVIGHYLYYRVIVTINLPQLIQLLRKIQLKN